MSIGVICLSAHDKRMCLQTKETNASRSRKQPAHLTNGQKVCSIVVHRDQSLRWKSNHNAGFRTIDSDWHGHRATSYTAFVCLRGKETRDNNGFRRSFDGGRSRLSAGASWRADSQFTERTTTPIDRPAMQLWRRGGWREWIRRPAIC